MKKFCVITNKYKDENGVLSERISNYLKENGCICEVRDITGESGDFVDPGIDRSNGDPECIITIGGDGTLLHAAKYVMDFDPVIIGVNRGRIGFLAELSDENVVDALDALINNKFKKEQRMMLEGLLLRDGREVVRSTVLNDIIVHRGGNAEISYFTVYVNGKLLTRYAADGVIISTPTGSTAYNLSAGGPIARPTSNIIIMTPICPHTITNRSILFTENDEIEIVVEEVRNPEHDNRKLSFDNQIYNVVSNDRIKVSVSPKTTAFARVERESFLQVVKNKLGGV